MLNPCGAFLIAKSLKPLFSCQNFINIEASLPQGRWIPTKSEDGGFKTLI